MTPEADQEPTEIYQGLYQAIQGDWKQVRETLTTSGTAETGQGPRLQAFVL